MTPHPWGLGTPKRTNKPGQTWSRQRKPPPEMPEPKRPRERSAAQCEHLPVPVAIAGFDPDRVERLRAGYWPGWAR